MFLNLFIASLIPIVLAIIFYYLNEKTNFSKIPYIWRQIIIGVCFGGAAVYATEFGVNIQINNLIIDGASVSNATANIRDASPIIAGLFFGGPAGIIAGCIGGVERFFAAYWGKGALTQVACSLSTLLAGLYAAFLRKFFFRGKNPKWWFAIAIGTVMEVIHFLIVFITNIRIPTEILKIISALATPMILANSFAIFVPAAIFQYLHKQHHKENPEKHIHKKLSTQVQWWLLGSIVACYVVSTFFLYIVQTNTAYQEANETFTLTINDVKKDVDNVLEKNLYNIRNEISDKPAFANRDDANEFCATLATKYNVTTVDLINQDGEFEYCSIGMPIEDFTMIMYPDSPEAAINDKMINGKDDVYIREFQRNADENKLMKYGYIKYDDSHYIAIGLDKDQYYWMINTEVISTSDNRHILTSGYILVYNPEKGMVNNPPEGVDIDITLDEILASKENTRIRTDKLGYDSFYMYTTVTTYEEFYTIVIVLPYDDVLFDRDSSFMLNSFMEILVFAVLFTLIYFLLDRSVVKKIEVINNDLNEITSGNLDKKVNVKSSREFASLSDDINFTVDALKGYIDAANKRIDEELAFAKSIQTSVLPSTFPAFPDRKEFDIHASMHTAKEVGGDFYDFYFSNSNTFHFTIADVSGKGIPAALFMMRSKQALKSLAQTNIAINEVFERGNNNLYEGNEAGMFVTAWSASINLDTGKLTFANGGHNPPLLKRKDGTFEYLKSRPNMVLAGVDNIPYTLNELDMNPGDTIFLYTDGVTEGINESGEQFGEERLRNTLNSKAFNSDKEICDFVNEEVKKFAGKAEQFDDITILAFTYNGIKK